MKIPKDFCIEAKNALRIVNKKFATCDVPKVKIKKLDSDMFSRTIPTNNQAYEASECAAISRVNGFYYRQRDIVNFESADHFAEMMFTEMPHETEKFNKLVKFLKSSNVNENALKKIENSNDNPYELYMNLIRAMENCFSDEEKIMLKQIQGVNQNSLRVQQKINEYSNKRMNVILGIQEICADKSVLPRVVEIEKVLVEKYGVKKALLNNDVEAAESILKAVKILKDNDEKICDEYIVTHLLNSGGIFIRADNKNVAIISSTPKMNIQEKYNKYILQSQFWHFSQNKVNREKMKEVNDALQIERETLKDIISYNFAIHESLHIGEGSFQPLFAKKIPKKYVDAARKVGSYGFMHNPVELYTELRTKKLMNAELGDLSSGEEELLSYFNKLLTDKK